MAKIPSGLWTGVLTSFGEYDQCLSIVSPKRDDSESDMIYGKYCFVRFSISEEIKNLALQLFDQGEMHEKFKVLTAHNLFDDKFYAFNAGICIPSQCSAHDVQNVFDRGLKEF